MPKIVIGISGASGAIYADQVLSFLATQPNVQICVVATPNGRRILMEEIGKKPEDYGFEVVSPKTYNVPFVSGSNPYDTLLVIPCSMGTLGRIAHGFADDTIARTADVFFKEKKKVILVPRETPLSLIHLENMKLLMLAGAEIIPAIPSFYSLPKTVEEVAGTVSSRILDHLGFPNDLMERWKM